MSDTQQAIPMSYTLRSRGRRYARMQFQAVLDRLEQLEMKVTALEASHVKPVPKKRGPKPKPKNVSEQVPKPNIEKEADHADIRIAE